MSPLLIGALAGGGLGLMKSEKGRAQAKRDQILAAQLMQTTPYGNMWKQLADQYAASGASAPDDMTALAEGGLGGASVGQMFQKQGSESDLYGNLAKYIKSRTANQEVDEMIGGMPKTSGFGEDLYQNLQKKKRYSLGVGVE